MNITIYTKSNCPNCVSAKALLKSKGLDYTERNTDDDKHFQYLQSQFPEIRQMPQIFIDDQRIGGFEALKTYMPQILAMKDDWK